MVRRVDVRMERMTTGNIGRSEGSRIYLWDNLKFLLIVFVVIGHFADLCITEPSFRSIFLWIYSFHMPLFVFVSGLLHNNKNVTKKIVMNLSLGYLLKINYFIVKAALGQKPGFSVFSEHGVPWFMFALAAFLFLSYVVRKMDYKYILIMSVIVACFAGYDKSVGDFLILSRIFVFYPFYVLGILLQDKIRDGIKVAYVWKLAAAFLLILWAWICFRFDVMYELRSFFTGRNPFPAIYYPFGCLIRLCCYMISVVLGGAFICLIPNRRLPVISKFGTRTLQVYFWHYSVIYIMQDKLDLAAWNAVRAGKLTFLLSAIVLAFALSLDVFGYPLGYVMGRKNRKSCKKDISL